jgi:hypothetical protein
VTTAVVDNRRLCGRALTRFTNGLAAELLLPLTNHFEMAESNPELGPYMKCRGLTCQAEGASEYDPDRELVFVTDPVRGVVLDQVLYVERVVVGEPYLTERNTWVEARRAALAGGRCTTSAATAPDTATTTATTMGGPPTMTRGCIRNGQRGCRRLDDCCQPLVCASDGHCVFPLE